MIRLKDLYASRGCAETIIWGSKPETMTNLALTFNTRWICKNKFCTMEVCRMQNVNHLENDAAVY